jgi:hypothetical protein
MKFQTRSTAQREPAGWSERHCSGRSLDVFFRRDEEPDRVWRRRQEIAIGICAGCPVLSACLAESLELRDFEGVRAGRSGTARRRLYLGLRRQFAASGDVPDAA